MQPVRNTTGRIRTARSDTVPSIPTIHDVGVCAADFPWDATGLVRVKRPTDDVVMVAGSGLQLRVTGDSGTSPSSRGDSPVATRTEKMGVAGACQNLKESRHKLDFSDQPVVMRDSSQVSKGRKKKKIFRKSQTFPDDLCSLDGGQGQEGSNEHSSKSKKRVKKSRRHCDIHGSRRGSAGTVPSGNQGTDPHAHAAQLRAALTAVAEGADRSTNSSPNTELVCTCKPKKSRRPDPEGRSSTGPRILSEYDKIIFGNEPLFSDYDDDPMSDEQIRGEVERYHKRSHHSDIFAAAQMVNTNTMLKFAIIATELQNIINVSLKRVRQFACIFLLCC